MEELKCEIRIQVVTDYIDEQSEPDESRYVFTYTITISNEGNVPAQLMSRHWIITDANGEQREVRGDGVVGEQPRLEPGDVHEYHSMADLSTAWGTMEGTYHFVTDDGGGRDVEIGRFFLAESAENSFVAE